MGPVPIGSRIGARNISSIHSILWECAGAAVSASSRSCSALRSVSRLAGADVAGRPYRTRGPTLRPASLRLWRGIAAVTAIALYSGHSLYLSGALAPSAKRGADLGTPAQPDSVARTPPTPALRRAAQEPVRARHSNQRRPADAEDLAAAAAFYDAHSGSLLWVAESGISARGNAVIAELRNADDWGLRARDFALPQLPAGAILPRQRPQPRSS